jgi:murein L,D-transpeptidase YafK
MIRVRKNDHILELIKDNKPVKTYKIALGFNNKGSKLQEGDGKTPEGIYYIESKKTDSVYHKALKISYPNNLDKENARSRGVSPGGNIMIHGIRNGLGFIGKYHKFIDWTKGCIAVTNEEIEEIYLHVKIGTKIEILP